MRWEVLVTGVVMAVCAPTVGWACSCDVGPDAILVGEQLPVNAGGVLFLTGMDGFDVGEPISPALRLERQEEGGGFVDEPLVTSSFAYQDGYGRHHRIWIEPAAGFVKGARYRLVGPGSQAHTGGPFQEEFTVTASVTELAPTVAVGEPVRGDAWFEGDGCEHAVDAVTRTVSVEFPEAEAYGEAVGYELLVDGQPWAHWESTCSSPRFGALGRAHTEAIIPVACGDWRRGLAEGDHTVSVRAMLLGTDVAFESEPQTFTWSCGGDDEGDVNAAGCAQGGGRVPAPLGWLGLGVALGWFVRRRR